MAIRVVRTDRDFECHIIDKGLRDRGVELVILPDGVGEDDLAAAAADADLILMCYTPITARIIASAKQLKGIVKYGVGIDAIDIPAAIARRIPVVNVPDYAEETVAEAAFAMMIALAKKLLPIHAAVQSDGWIWPTDRWLAGDIAEKTVGLVGMGRIGASMARMAGAGFRARVVGFDPFVEAADMANAGVEKFHDLHTMLAECDFVSIHCVLNKQTRHMIGKAEFAAMKRTAVLINVSRGAIVDEPALVEAIVSGQIGGAGLDVCSVEPLNKTDHMMSPLYGRDNVILTPHLAFYTADAMRRLEQDTLARCYEILEGRPVRIRSKDPRLLAQAHGIEFAG
jgi:D-3-phosphoglycerate dehydrogenase